MPPVDASSTTTPNLWSTLPSTSVLASKRKETVLKAFSIVHHERGDARLGHGAEGSPRRVLRHCAPVIRPGLTGTRRRLRRRGPFGPELIIVQLRSAFEKGLAPRSPLRAWRSPA